MNCFSSFARESGVKFTPECDFLDDLCNSFLFLFGSFFIILMVWISITKLFLLLMNKHLYFSFDSFPESQLAIQLSIVNAFQCFRGYSLSIPRIRGLQLFVIDVFGDEESVDKELFSEMIITYWWIVDFIESFSFEFQDDFVEHDFIIFINLNSFLDQTGKAISVFFRSLFFKDDVYLVWFNRLLWVILTFFLDNVWDWFWMIVLVFKYLKWKK